MSSDVEPNEMLWWVIKPPETSRMARALQHLHIKRIAHLLVIPIANFDGTLSHVISVPRGPLVEDRARSHEDH